MLLRKLAEINITKSFWLWMQSFLEGRSQQVKIHDTLSCKIFCPSRVPQGSVLSPKLFNVYSNDLEDCIPKHLSINTHKYADDCTQGEEIPHGGTSNMQDILNKMNDWARRSKMELNPKKTKDIWICFKQNIPEPPLLAIGDDMIDMVKSFKLLGLWCSNSLK